MLEQTLEKLLVGFQATSVGPVASNRVTNFSQLRQTPFGPFFHEDKMHAVAGFDGTEPLSDSERRSSASLANLSPNCFAISVVGARFESVLQKEGIA